MQTPDSSPHGSPFNYGSGQAGGTSHLTAASSSSSSMSAQRPTAAETTAGCLPSIGSHHTSPGKNNNSRLSTSSASSTANNSTANSILSQQLQQPLMLLGVSAGSSSSAAASPVGSMQQLQQLPSMYQTLGTSSNNSGSSSEMPSSSSSLQQQQSGLVGDAAARSLPTPEMSPPEHGDKDIHTQQQQQYNSTSGLYTTSLSHFSALQSEQQRSHSLASAMSTQQAHQRLYGQPAPAHLLYAKPSYSPSEHLNAAGGGSDASSAGIFENPVSELISKFSPSSSSFLKNVCPPFTTRHDDQSPPASLNHHHHHQTGNGLNSALGYVVGAEHQLSSHATPAISSSSVSSASSASSASSGSHSAYAYPMGSCLMQAQACGESSGGYPESGYHSAGAGGGGGGVGVDGSFWGYEPNGGYYSSSSNSAGNPMHIYYSQQVQAGCNGSQPVHHSHHPHHDVEQMIVDGPFACADLSGSAQYHHMTQMGQILQYTQQSVDDACSSSNSIYGAISEAAETIS